MNLKIATFVPVLLLAWIYSAGAQMISEQSGFHRLSHEGRLNQSLIDEIFQDSDGYMWFGTHGGLHKFNGYEVTVYDYDPEDPNSINYSQIGSIYEDDKNNLWFGTRGKGLSLYHRDKDHFTTYELHYEKPEHGPSENTIYAIAQSKDGFLWIGTDNGLNRFDIENEIFEHFFAESGDSLSLIDNAITSLVVDSYQNLWIGTRNGITIRDLETGEFRQLTHDPDDPTSIGSDRIEYLYESRDGTIWVGTRYGGLNVYDRDTDSFRKYIHNSNDPQSISGNTVYSIHEDRNGLLWVGTMNEGLNAFDRENEIFQRFRHDLRRDNSLSYDTVYSLFESDNGILWVGTIGGLNMLDLKPPMFEQYRPNPDNEYSLSHNIVQSFWEDHSGNLWVGTDGGGLNLFERDSKKFSAYRHIPGNPNSLPDDIILDITSRNDDYLWLATYSAGITRFDVKRHEFKHYPYDPENPTGLNIPHTYRLLFYDNQLLVGTHQGGLNVLNLETDEFRHYMRDDETPGNIPSEYIQSLYTDSRQTLWVGFHGAGLAEYDSKNDTFTSYSESHGTLSSIVVNATLEDHTGKFWVATNNGLNLFDRESKSYTVYKENEGLANNVINGLLEDGDGNLWMSTNEGISKFYPDSETFENYGEESGLKKAQYNPRAFFKDSEGYLYFGSMEGFTRFHPDNVSLNENVAPVILSNLMIFNQPVEIGAAHSPLEQHISQTASITLPYDQSVLTFEYIAQNFEINKNDEFAYMLEGFDNDWNYVGTKRSATYTNLNPGEYILRVKSASSSGIWGEQEAALGLNITPPFWKTTWFYILSGLFIAGLITAGYHARVYTISERNKRLEKEVARQTSELSGKNSELILVLKDLKQTRNELVEKAHKAGMADLATSVLHNVGNILNSVNVSASHITDIINESQLKNLQKANRLLREKRDNIDHFIQVDPKGKKLLDYYLELEEPIRKEHEQLTEQNQRLTEKINLIIDVVLAQQNYSKAGRLKETVSLQQMVEDTITLQASSFENHNLTIIKDYQPVAGVEVERSKLVHILVNLLKNAKESIQEQNPDKKLITISIREDTVNSTVCLSISDTGTGIKKDQRSEIFTHGFTTKNTGHGFGLHSCANYMKEMGGKISVESEGRGKGATFTLWLPAKAESDTTSSVEDDYNYETVIEKEKALKL